VLNKKEKVERLTRQEAMNKNLFYFVAVTDIGIRLRIAPKVSSFVE
jgi:hypothetical protein